MASFTGAGGETIELVPNISTGPTLFVNGEEFRPGGGIQFLGQSGGVEQAGIADLLRAFGVGTQDINQEEARQADLSSQRRAGLNQPQRPTNPGLGAITQGGPFADPSLPAPGQSPQEGGGIGNPLAQLEAIFTPIFGEGGASRLLSELFSLLAQLQRASSAAGGV